MPNDWFRFKQFLIRQDRTAMKVGTDGVLLGAWAGICHPARILDIGTGTGLVSLMLAQRFPEAIIDALEIDPESALQARENTGGSSWGERIRVIQADFLQWAPGGKYDLIVSNPPFFGRSLPSPDAVRNRARHDRSLPLDGLITGSSGILEPGGGLSLVIPIQRLPEVVTAIGRASLLLNRIARVRATPASPVKRLLIHLGRSTAPPEISELVIEAQPGSFSEEFRGLIEEFYLESSSSVNLIPCSSSSVRIGR